MTDCTDLIRTIQMSSLSFARANKAFQAMLLQLGQPPSDAERVRTLEQTCRQMYARIRDLEQQLEERNP